MAISVILGYHIEKKKCYVFTLKNIEKDFLANKDLTLFYQKNPTDPQQFRLTYSNTSLRLADDLSRGNQNPFLTPFHLFHVSEINFDLKTGDYDIQLIANQTSVKENLKLSYLGEVSGMTSYEYNENLNLSILYELAKSSISRFHCFQTNFY